MASGPTKPFWGFEDDIFKITSRAIDINDTRALQVFRQIGDALRNMGKIVLARKIAIFGASYREDIGDSEMLVRKHAEMGAEIFAPTILMSCTVGI